MGRTSNPKRKSTTVDGSGVVTALASDKGCPNLLGSPFFGVESLDNSMTYTEVSN
jgi:hypothetical protein